MHPAFRAISWFARASWVLGTQAPLPYKAKVWRFISEVQVLKVRVPNVGFKLFTPQGKDPVFELLLDCRSLAGGGGF